MYTSGQIQNEIISACNEMILQKVVEKANKSHCFSVAADETTDISTTEQVSICIRFLDEDENVIESFLQFVSVTSTRGEDLAKTILDSLESMGLDLKYLRGQGYDGAAAMSGKFNGVQAKILEKFPTALYVHCASHSFNLAISDACQIREIRNCMGIIEKAYAFMNTPKRNAVLQGSIMELCPESRGETLKKLSPTRWVERHKSVMVMVELLTPLVDSLEKIEDLNDKESASGAHLLLNSIKSANFVLSLFTIEKLYSYTLPLSKMLQTMSLDLVSSVEMTENIVSELENIRKSSGEVFSQIFHKSSAVLEEIIDEQFKITIPRLASHQTNRSDFRTESPEAYFRIYIFIQFLDSMISQLKERFIKHKTVLQSLNILIPGRSQNGF